MRSVYNLLRELRALPLVLMVPVAIFAVLRVLPQLDLVVWGDYWISPLLHYYIVSFASFMALVTAVSINVAIGQDATVRTFFMTHAFAGISALLLVRGLSTPSVLLESGLNVTFIWSMRLSLLVGAIFFAIAVYPWSTAVNQTILKYRRPLTAFLLLLYITYLIIGFAYPDPLDILSNNSDAANLITGIISVTLYLWAAYRLYQAYLVDQQVINRQISISLILLAQAQLAGLFGNWGRITWMMSHILIIGALAVALYALLINIRSRRHIQAAQYFGALGSILIVLVALTVGEVGTRLLQEVATVRRTVIVTITLIQAAISFTILYIIVIYLDKLIQERTQALTREQELRAELSRLIVHDLKNPLTVITSGLNLLAHGNFNSSPETQTRLIQQLESAGDNVLGLINDLLNVEKMEANEFELQFTAVNTAVLLKNRIDDYQILAATHKQTLQLEMPAQMPIVQADAELLSRVIDNLLANALKYTPEHGDVLVSAIVQPARLTLYFDDSGPGIPPDDRERIFEKFSQVRGSERRGAGLGLTFCRMVINAHSGHVEVNTSPLGGARFAVHLPLQPTEPEANGPAAVSPDNLSNTPARA